MLIASWKQFSKIKFVITAPHPWTGLGHRQHNRLDQKTMSIVEAEGTQAQYRIWADRGKHQNLTNFNKPKFQKSGCRRRLLVRNNLGKSLLK